MIHYRKLLFITFGIFTFSIGANAQVPTKDKANINQHTDTKKHWLETVKVQSGQSKSTEGVRCSWGFNKKTALEKRSDVAAKVAQTCAAAGVPPSLGLAIAFQESRFNQNCVAPTTPHSGGQRARGVMQVLQATGQKMFTKHGLGTYRGGTNEDHNIKAGCLYLAEGLKITNGSKYHTAGGYHAGYGSKVWRNNLAIPKRWPKTLNYAEQVANRWEPYYRNELKGFSAGRYSSDLLKTDTFTAGSMAVPTIQNDINNLNGRYDDFAGNIGQAETERQEWLHNSSIRNLNTQSMNAFVNALSVLGQFKLEQLTTAATNESISNEMTSTRNTAPTQTADGRRLIFDDINRRWIVENHDGSWSYYDVQGNPIVEYDVDTTATQNSEAEQAARDAQAVRDLLN